MSTTKEKLQQLKDRIKEIRRVQKKYKALNDKFIKKIQPMLDQQVEEGVAFGVLHCQPIVIVALNGHINYTTCKDNEVYAKEAMYRGIKLVNINTLF